MLRRVDNAIVRYRGGLFGGQLILLKGANRISVYHTNKNDYEILQKGQQQKPLRLWKFNGRNYWWFRDAVYWESEGLNPDQAYALLVTREQQRQRHIERAQAIVTQGPQDEGFRRSTISVEVRNYVFQRDGGQCLACGAKVELQFDHIIPVALGGSSEPENLQVLCGPCNRRKGASLG
jgi:hypothetical protein